MEILPPERPLREPLHELGHRLEPQVGCRTSFGLIGEGDFRW